MRHREDNPSPALLPLLYVAGVVSTVGAIYVDMTSDANVFGRRKDRGERVLLLEHRTGLIFFAPDNRLDGIMIDFPTGRGGFTHVAVYPAIQKVDGTPVLFHSSRTDGSAFVQASRFAGRKAVAVLFPERWTPYVQGACFGCEGRVYKLADRRSLHCAEVALMCCPPPVREHVLDRLGEKPITPNSLAAALGVSVASSDELETDELLKRLEEQVRR